MSKILEVLMNVRNQSMAYLAKESARRKLLARSDRLLADVGISRELLEDGVGAWPWRVEQLGENVKRADAGRFSQLRDLFSKPDFAAMGFASKGARGFFG